MNNNERDAKMNRNNSSKENTKNGGYRKNTGPAGAFKRNKENMESSVRSHNGMLEVRRDNIEKISDNVEFIESERKSNKTNEGNKNSSRSSSENSTRRNDSNSGYRNDSNRSNINESENQSQTERRTFKEDKPAFNRPRRQFSDDSRKNNSQNAPSRNENYAPSRNENYRNAEQAYNVDNFDNQPQRSLRDEARESKVNQPDFDEKRQNHARSGSRFSNYSRNRSNDRGNGFSKRPNSQMEVEVVQNDGFEGGMVQENSNGILRMVALSGTEEIGMNMTLYSYEYKNGKKFTILVDCGVSFESLPGSNVVMPNLAILKDKGIRIDAIVLTHGHEDHIGAIPYLYDYVRVPMYATPFTCGLINRKMDYIKKKDYQLELVKCGETRNIGPFKIKWIAATHSIPDNAMLAIEVEGVRVLHTGDWKLDPEPVVGANLDYQSLIEFGKKGVHALISDSTNIHEAETANSEGDVAVSLKNLVKNTTSGRFILTCFSSNIARVKSCLEAARAANKKVLILGNSLKRSTEVAQELGFIDDEVIIDEEQANEMRPNELLIVCTGSQGEENSALWKMANKLRTAGSVIEKGDTVVFSARVIDGKQHSVRTIINQLVERGVRLMHPWNSKASCIHASGHPAKPDIAQLMEWIKPNYVVPVHSEAEHRISHIAFAKSKGYKTFNLKNGMVISIGDEVTKVGNITCERLAYDGNRLISYTSEVFKQRKTLNENGVLMISVGVKNKKLSSMVTSCGVYDKDADINHKKALALSKLLKFDIDRILGGFSSSDMYAQENMIRKKVTEVARNAVWLQIKKNPIISCHVVG